MWENHQECIVCLSIFLLEIKKKAVVACVCICVCVRLCVFVWNCPVPQWCMFQIHVSLKHRLRQDSVSLLLSVVEVNSYRSLPSLKIFFWCADMPWRLYTHSMSAVGRTHLNTCCPLSASPLSRPTMASQTPLLHFLLTSSIFGIALDSHVWSQGTYFLLRTISVEKYNMTSLNYRFEPFLKGFKSKLHYEHLKKPVLSCNRFTKTTGRRFKTEVFPIPQVFFS